MQGLVHAGTPRMAMRGLILRLITFEAHNASMVTAINALDTPAANPPESARGEIWTLQQRGFKLQQRADRRTIRANVSSPELPQLTGLEPQAGAPARCCVIVVAAG